MFILLTFAFLLIPLHSHLFFRKVFSISISTSSLTAGPAPTAYLAGIDLPVNGMTLTIIKSAVLGERGEESLLLLVLIPTNPILTD